MLMHFLSAPFKLLKMFVLGVRHAAMWCSKATDSLLAPKASRSLLNWAVMAGAMDPDAGRASAQQNESLQQQCVTAVNAFDPVVHELINKAQVEPRLVPIKRVIVADGCGLLIKIADADQVANLQGGAAANSAQAAATNTESTAAAVQQIDLANQQLKIAMPALQSCYAQGMAFVNAYGQGGTQISVLRALGGSGQCSSPSNPPNDCGNQKVGLQSEATTLITALNKIANEAQAKAQACEQKLQGYAAAGNSGAKEALQAIDGSEWSTGEIIGVGVGAAAGAAVLGAGIYAIVDKQQDIKDDRRRQNEREEAERAAAEAKKLECATGYAWVDGDPAEIAKTKATQEPVKVPADKKGKGICVADAKTGSTIDGAQASNDETKGTGTTGVGSTGTGTVPVGADGQPVLTSGASDNTGSGRGLAGAPAGKTGAGAAGLGAGGDAAVGSGRGLAGGGASGGGYGGGYGGGGYGRGYGDNAGSESTGEGMASATGLHENLIECSRKRRPAMNLRGKNLSEADCLRQPKLAACKVILERRNRIKKDPLLK